MTNDDAPKKVLRQVHLAPDDAEILDEAAARLNLPTTETQRWVIRYLVRPWLDGRVTPDQP